MDRNRSKQIKPTRATAVATTLLLLAVMLGSCTKELTDGELPSPNGESLEVCITFPKSEQPQAANAGTAEEQQIDHMTIFVFNADGTTLESMLNIDLTLANTSLPDQQPQWESDKTLIVRPITDKTSLKRIYAVANWTKTYFDKATYTEAMLKDELSTIVTVDELATPLLMSGSNSVDFSTSDSKVTIELKRQVAKLNINLTVDAEVKTYLPNVEWLKNAARITVGNIPDQSYVVGQTPAALPANYTLLVSGFIPMTASASGGLKWNKSVYVHENPVTGSGGTSKEKATWLVINLPYRNRSTGAEQFDNCYQIYLDNIGDANPYQVLRNTIYNSNLKVVGLGLPLAEINTKSSPQRSALATSQMRMQSMFQGIIVDVDVVSLSGRAE